MKKITKIALLCCVLLSFTQCKEKELVAVETFEMTPEYAKKIDKPEVHFRVNVPVNLKFDKPVEGKKTSSYGMVQKVGDDGVVTEMYSFGYISLDGMEFEKNARSFMVQIRDMLKRGGYTLESHEIGMMQFDGEEYMSLQAVGVMKEGISSEFVGKYMFNTVVKLNPYGNTHIIMLMAARDGEAAKTFEDFKDKLTISTIWKTFEYLQ